MKRILLLTDYKGHFGSKYNATPYRSGMDKNLLIKYFDEYDVKVEYLKFHEIFNNGDNQSFSSVLYTSSEDEGYHYKNFIEDIVFSLERLGFNLLPSYVFLRANNNKVFMEILKRIVFDNSINNLKAYTYGSIEEIDLQNIDYPIVLKSSTGAMSKGVFLANCQEDLIRSVKTISYSADLGKKLKEIIRSKKHKGYLQESLFRKKFILQQFIPGLKSDFKILVFGNRYYIFERPVRKNDFRASGSGNKNYIYGSKVKLPEGIFDFAEKIFLQAKVPHLSLDIAYDGSTFYLIEFQAVFFGTVGHYKSDGYYIRNGKNWLFKNENFDLEKVYADAVSHFLEKL